jgi:hypothetical protein
MTSLSRFRFRFRSSPNDRVTDNRAQFALRLQDHTSPRQRRLAAEKRLLIASYHEHVTNWLGGIALAILIICLFFI